ncbi:hypothetical protein GCM10023149_15710 [Mucilaginibacter gynuensis]|uniref:HTH luxR-type domain-containing protein n=1 Tax=Mucilaginibacter gynuensis TaxID=1302236 RepID=A0ABP8G5H5_9SPHI
MNDLNSYTEFLERARLVDADDMNQEHWETQIQQGRYYKYYKEYKPGIYVLDFTKQAYLYCNEVMASMADYPIPILMTGGLKLALKIWHPDDLAVYDRFILPDNLAFLRKVSVADYGNYLFTCNYRVRHRNGRYIKIEQSSFFSKSLDNGMPLMTIGFLRDITNRTTDNAIIHTIEKIDIKGNTLLHRRIHEPDLVTHILTPRECEILELVVQGKSSHEIAALLNIEKYTVDNHRKNMLKKTGTQNMVQLAIMHYRDKSKRLFNS